MVLALQIDKDKKEDCPFDCPFRDNRDEREQCTLFNRVLEREGYYDSYSIVACYPCQNMFEENQKTIAQQPHGAEPSEICPKCDGKEPFMSSCDHCLGSGKNCE